MYVCYLSIKNSTCLENVFPSFHALLGLFVSLKFTYRRVKQGFFFSLEKQHHSGKNWLKTDAAGGTNLSNIQFYFLFNY